MNFFGHVAVALQRRRDAAFLLGVMLPDFASMCGARMTSSDEAIAAGIAHHHRVDRVFHGAPAFLALLGEATASLRGREVARGPARGAAHLSVELLLDGALAADRPAADLFRAALAEATPDRLGRALAFDDAPAAERFWRLQRRLCAQPLPAAYAEPAFVCDRVVATLARRPRLALDAAAAHALADALPALRARVAAQAHELAAAVARVV